MIHISVDQERSYHFPTAKKQQQRKQPAQQGGQEHYFQTKKTATATPHGPAYITHAYAEGPLISLSPRTGLV